MPWRVLDKGKVTTRDRKKAIAPAAMATTARVFLACIAESKCFRIRLAFCDSAGHYSALFASGDGLKKDREFIINCPTPDKVAVIPQRFDMTKLHHNFSIFFAVNTFK